MVRQWQDLFYDKRFSQTRLVNPDFELICKAYKIKYRCCNSPSDIEDAVEEMAASKGPFLLDAFVDAEYLDVVDEHHLARAALLEDVDVAVLQHPTEDLQHFKPVLVTHTSACLSRRSQSHTSCQEPSRHQRTR